MISANEASQIFKQKLMLKMSKTSDPIIADRDYPPFDRVMMDGIAVSFETYETGLRKFALAGVQPAGLAAKVLIDMKTCLEVMTGAPLPIGTNLVIPYEHLDISDGVARIVNETQRSKMDNVHLMGSDCHKGAVVLEAGVSLNGPHQGIAASMGVISKLSASSRILIISTGDELVEVHETPLDHQIRRSNAHAILLRIISWSRLPYTT